MKKRYQKPQKNELPSRRKLAAVLAEKEQALALSDVNLDTVRERAFRAEEAEGYFRRECRRLEKEVEELTGDEWKHYCKVEARRSRETMRTLDVGPGHVHVGLAFKWDPWRRRSRGREADEAVLREVRKRLLEAAAQKLDVELQGVSVGG